MAITAGSLRHRITIQQLTTSQDAYGGIIETWTDLKTVWADVSPLSGREFWEAQQINSQIEGKIVIRYMTGVKPDMRVKFGSRYLYIEAVINPKEKRELLHLYYREAAD